MYSLMSLENIAENAQAAWATAMFELKLKLSVDSIRYSDDCKEFQDYFSDAISEMKTMIRVLETVNASEINQKRKSYRAQIAQEQFKKHLNFSADEALELAERNELYERERKARK